MSSKESVEEFEKLMFKELEDKDVSVLVNNVGCCFYGKMDSHSIWDIMRQINVNVNAQTYLTRFMLPRLLKRQRSAIMDISSVCGITNGDAMLPIYSATKAYNRSFSLSIQKAYADKIDVMVVTPDSTKTQMNSGRYLFSITADVHACQTINHLGRYNETYGNWKHASKPYLMSIPIFSHSVLYINA